MNIEQELELKKQKDDLQMDGLLSRECAESSREQGVCRELQGAQVHSADRKDHQPVTPPSRELTAINQMGHTLLAGHGNIENKISSLTDLIRKWHSDLRAQIADMKNNCRPRFECPDQWTLFGQKCYFFSPRVEDWLSSQRFCASNMANLAVIDRSDKQAFVVNEIKSTRHWIGLNESSTDGAWLWVDGTDYPSSQKFWSSGEPRSIGSYEACVGINRDGNWVVYSCSEKMNFICERPVFCRFK